MRTAVIILILALAITGAAAGDTTTTIIKETPNRVTTTVIGPDGDVEQTRTDRQRSGDTTVLRTRRVTPSYLSVPYDTSGGYGTTGRYGR